MYIIIPPQGYYGDFATVIAISITKEEAIEIAEKEDAVAYSAAGYSVGEKISRAAVDRIRLDGRIAERPAPTYESVIDRLRRK